MPPVAQSPSASVAPTIFFIWYTSLLSRPTIDTNGRTIITPAFDSIIEYNHDYFLLQQNQLWGLYSVELKKKVVDTQFEKISDVQYRSCIVKKNNLYGVIDFYGKMLIDLQYEDIERSNESRFIIMKNDKYGMTDSFGKIVVPLQYDLISNDECDEDEYDEKNRMLAIKGDSIFLWDSSGITMKKIFIPNFQHTLQLLEEDDNYDVGEYDFYCEEQNWGILPFIENNKIGVKNYKSNRIVIPALYNGIELDEGIFFALENEKYDIYNFNGKRISNFEIYDYDLKGDWIEFSVQKEIISLPPSRYSKKKPAIQQGSRVKHGVMDKNGKIIIEAKYDGIYRENEGLWCIKKDTLFGYVNSQGREIIPAQFTRTTDFSNGVSFVEKNGKWGAIRPSGSYIIPVQYDKLGLYDSKFHNRMIPALQNGKYGYVDVTGKLAIACQFDWAANFTNGMAEVRKSNKTFFIDLKGNCISGCDQRNGQ